VLLIDLTLRIDTTNRLGTVFQLEGHSWFVTQENIDRFQPRGNTRSAAEDDVEANERGTSERGARGNPCADFVAPISLARERLRRRTRAHGARELAFTRFRGSIAAFTRFPSV